MINFVMCNIKFLKYVFVRVCVVLREGHFLSDTSDLFYVFALLYVFTFCVSR